MIWFSRWVPKEFQHLEPKNPIQFSLRTSDRKRAIVEARRIAAEQDRAWRASMASDVALPVTSPVTKEDLDEAVYIVGHELPLEEAQDGIRNLRGKGPHMWRAHLNWVAAEFEEQARLTATGDFSAVSNEAELIAATFGPVSDAQFSEICEQLNRIRLDTLRLKARRAAGDVEADSNSSIVEAVRSRRANKARDGERLEDFFEHFATECLAKGEKRPDTVTQDRKVIQLFSEFVGRERAADSITALEVAEFRDTMLALPPRWKSKRELGGLSIRAAAKRARELEMPRTAFTTVNKFLSTISPIYKWLAKQPAWAGLHNPCDGLFHAKVKGKNPRPPFSTQQLNTIISSPLFTGFLRDGCEDRPGGQLSDDWRKWVLLICMFTGARIGEIAQLLIGDVENHRGTWVIHLREDEKMGLTKKNRKSHFVPIHQHLLAMGLEQFLNRQSDSRDKNEPLFQDLERDGRGHFGKVSRWYRDYLEAIGIKNGRDGVGMHSFRHTIVDRMRSEANLLDHQIAIVLDHSMKSTTGGYGKIQQGTLRMLSEWIESITWEGVDFSAVVPFENA